MERTRFRPPSTQAPHPGRALLAWALATAAVVALAIHKGLPAPPAVAPWLLMAQIALPWIAVAVMGDLAWDRRPGLGNRRRWPRPMGLAVEVGVALAAAMWAAGLPEGAGVLAVLAAVGTTIALSGQLARSMRHPNLLLPISFAVLIAAATLLLKLPAATPAGQPIGWIDALFTATSAVCVTGLAVRDTAGEFTLFGQAVILGAIQLGGLGFMIFGSTLALLFGVRPSYQENLTLSAALDEYPAHRIMRFAWFIVAITLAIEAIGAALLYLLWPESLTSGAGGRLWQAVFHSVSAFCNAGFDVTGNSLQPLRYHVAPFLVIAPLIVVGGLGFLVLEDVARFVRLRLQKAEGRPPARLTTHTKIVLATTACLLAAGVIVIFVAASTSRGGPSVQALADAVFMSASARTAGFNTIPMHELSPGSRFTIIVLMAIGGSPGSTAGGMKTTVLALLLLAALATIRNRHDIEAFGRAIPDALVRKAATVAAGLLGVVVLSTLVLDLTESIDFEPLLFEVVSAASTTGLSLGATRELSPFGRLVITATMFAGRLGALSLLGALVQGAGAGGERALTRSRLPRDTVSLG